MQGNQLGTEGVGPTKYGLTTDALCFGGDGSKKKQKKKLRNRLFLPVLSIHFYELSCARVTRRACEKIAQM
jgi:hypothetical protein